MNSNGKRATVYDFYDECQYVANRVGEAAFVVGGLYSPSRVIPSSAFMIDYAKTDTRIHWACWPIGWRYKK